MLNATFSYFCLFICGLGHPFVFPLVKSVKAGKSASLACNATDVPGQNITWKRRNGQNENLRIVSDGKYEITYANSGSSQLTIKDISISDHGYYVCDISAIVNQSSSSRGFLGTICKLTVYCYSVSLDK